jgi:hypothetical protein
MSKSRCAWVREGEVAHPARARLRVRAARGTRITGQAQPRRLWRGPQHKGQSGLAHGLRGRWKDWRFLPISQLDGYLRFICKRDRQSSSSENNNCAAQAYSQ